MPASSPQITRQAAETLRALGEALRRHRRALKISATVAAEAAGVSRPTWHRIEKGEPSVTAGSYAAAALALGLDLGLATQGKAEVAAMDRKGWIPARVNLNDYPMLKQLAWQVHGTNELTPREALDIYRRNWRHLDAAALSIHERELLEALQAAFATDDALPTSPPPADRARP